MTSASPTCNWTAWMRMWHQARTHFHCFAKANTSLWSGWPLKNTDTRTCGRRVVWNEHSKADNVSFEYSELATVILNISSKLCSTFVMSCCRTVHLPVSNRWSYWSTMISTVSHPQQTIQSPDRLYKAPTDSTKPRRTIQSPNRLDKDSKY